MPCVQASATSWPSRTRLHQLLQDQLLEFLDLLLVQNLLMSLYLLDLLQDLHLQMLFVWIMSCGALLQDLMRLEDSTQLLSTMHLRRP